MLGVSIVQGHDLPMWIVVFFSSRPMNMRLHSQSAGVESTKNAEVRKRNQSWVMQHGHRTGAPQLCAIEV